MKKKHVCTLKTQEYACLGWQVGSDFHASDAWNRVRRMGPLEKAFGGWEATYKYWQAWVQTTGDWAF